MKEKKFNMHTESQAFLKALLIKSRRENQLLRYLPGAVAEQIQSFKVQHIIDLKKILSIDTWLKSIHPSWFTDVIKSYPPSVQTLFLSTLSTVQKKHIQHLLPLKKISISSPFVASFLMHILQNALQEQSVIHEELLPPSELNYLLTLERKSLIPIIDLLGLHDVATDLRQVIDKALLKKIYAVLTESQVHFLEYCSKQPLKWVSPGLGLSNWDGSKEQLNFLLHYRGLIRLAKAIVQENSSFIWHLLHRLDTGRAKTVQKELYRKQDPTLVPYFKHQVLHIAKRFQPK